MFQNDYFQQLIRMLFKQIIITILLILDVSLFLANISIESACKAFAGLMG